jgi:hypothetical protein
MLSRQPLPALLLTPLHLLLPRRYLRFQAVGEAKEKLWTLFMPALAIIHAKLTARSHAGCKLLEPVKA